MGDYLTTRTTTQSGSSGENIQKRSLADIIWLYAQSGRPLVYGLGGYAPTKKGQMQKVNGVYRTATKHTKKHEWEEEDLISFSLDGGAAVADATTTAYSLKTSADYNKVRVGETMRCKSTGELVLIVAKGSSPAVTIRRNLGGTSSNIPLNAEWEINSRSVKEYSSAGSQRDSTATNKYNLMQIVREDASLSRSEINTLMESQGKDYDPLGRRKAKSGHTFARYLDNALTFGQRALTTDADSNTVQTMGGLNYYADNYIYAASSGNCTSDFTGHGGTLSFDEFFEFVRIFAKNYESNETITLLGGSIWASLFTKWAMNFSGANWTLSTETDEFGMAINKIKTPWATIHHIPSGTVEENESGTGIFFSPKDIRVLFNSPIEYTEVDMKKTANRVDGTSFTYLTEATLEVLGTKRLGKITGVTGAEL